MAAVSCSVNCCPLRASCRTFTSVNTPAACSAPITETWDWGQENMKRGSKARPDMPYVPAPYDPVQRTVVKQHAVVGQNSDLVAVHARKSADQGLAVARLVFVKAAAVHHARDYLAHIKLHTGIFGDDAIE